MIFPSLFRPAGLSEEIVISQLQRNNYSKSAFILSDYNHAIFEDAVRKAPGYTLQGKGKGKAGWIFSTAG
jgi:hypothetical protein